MKSCKSFIQEALIAKKNKVKKYNNYFPKTKDELREIIIKRINDEGNKCDLNDIDVSSITDMSYLFEETDFNGYIAMWDVSGVTNMKCMFIRSKFNGDISNWDVSNVEDMSFMFSCSEFNGDISEWDVSNVKCMDNMFGRSPKAGNPPKWYKK